MGMDAATRSALECNLYFASLLKETRHSTDGDSETELEPESEDETTPPSRIRNSTTRVVATNSTDLSTRGSSTKHPLLSSTLSHPPPVLSFVSSTRLDTSSVTSQRSQCSEPSNLGHSLTAAAVLPPVVPTVRPFQTTASTAPRASSSIESSNDATKVLASNSCAEDGGRLSTLCAPVGSFNAPAMGTVSFEPLAATPPLSNVRKRPAIGVVEDETDNVPKKQSRFNVRRKFRRKEQKDVAGHTVATNHTIRRTILAASRLPVEIATRDFQIAYGAYTGVNSKPYGAQVRYTQERLENMGFQLIAWDGITPVLIVDREHRVFAVLAGRPGGNDYLQACTNMHNQLVELKKRITWKKKEKKHKRGTFIAINTGIGYGKGQKYPKRFTDDRQALVEDLLNDADVQRIASYQDAILARYFPKIYADYRSYMQKLQDHLPEERRNFRLSVFAAAAFNLGPDVWTWLHKDAKNYPGGNCFITALGPFDPTRSALLIMWELKMMVQFPSASTIGIPSASITHSNTPVADGDARSSFTQYTSGGIFRWLDYGGRTEDELKFEDYEEFLRLKDIRGSRWEHALSRFSTLTELLNTI